MRGPSTADCEKSFIRTGIPTANMLNRGFFDSTAFETPNSAQLQSHARRAGTAIADLVQILPAR